MPDDFASRTPRTWADAFATLPAATVPDGGWSRFEAVLDATATPARTTSIYGVRRRGLIALAASLALVAAVPWLVRLDDTAPSTSARVATDVRLPGPTVAGHQTAVRPSRSIAARAPVSAPDDVEPAAATAEVTTTARVAEPRREHRASLNPASARVDVASVAASMPPTSSAASAPSQPIGNAIEPTAGNDRNAAAEPAATALAQLHAESARLEALIALTRDDRVESATAALLADDLDLRIGLIDAALTESGLSASRRAALWQQRVSTLRDMAGMESTERWLAANGTASLGTLVRVD